MIKKMNPLLWSAVAFIALLYLINAVHFYRLIDVPMFDHVVDTQLRSNDEYSFMEISSALFWLVAFLLSINNMILSIRKYGFGKIAAWYLLFLLISLFAFGEEISWGHHFIDKGEITLIEKINAQEETNIHNINIAKLANVPDDRWYYYYLENPGRFLNPVFYLMLTFLWSVLPLVSRTKLLSRYDIIRSVPSPTDAFIYFMLFHIVFFCFVDIFLFNVSYIFELSISILACVVFVDYRKSLTAH